MKLITSMIALTAITTSTFSFADEKSANQDLVGNYACAFTQYSGDETYAYPDFKCKIIEKDGVLTLEKLSGSQRIKGVVTPTATGFEFEGTYFCPWGDCTHDVYGEFQTQKKGEFAGSVHRSTDPSDFTDVDLRRTK
ncbi:DUF4893 domain-containing protein [Vibrio nigripulchritudo]|uniref:DUF4893 domain-containing protein n=1 Tax=Vibrio nigripulchritudo TaxID=28173 RepID=UPI00248FBDDD|nr:DUF4893 domain-containing protein [Vibrio nigripulchritudo]BDU39160.1 hypothetical protein TUMSATVNIG2_36290 [Vibrio nigripulchritudo]BDU44880.1 hypothetical protein TUMSATVNIG3_36780 [Vibrio nigripulchritudo]